MDCNQKDFTVRGDKDNVLKNIVNRETVDKNSDLIKRDVYVAYLNGSEFLNYCKKVDDKFKNVISFTDAIKAKLISSNDVAKHLKEYYEINHPNVENYTATDIGGLSTEFTAPHIETLALNHVADLMLEHYSKNIKNTKPDIDTTLKEVSKYIMSGFRQEIEEINNSIEDNPKYHNRYKTKYEELRNRYEGLRNKEKLLLDYYKSEKDIKRKNNLRNEILENNKEIFNTMLDIAFNYGNTKQRNWGALANQVHTNKTEFYNKVFKNKKLFNIREYFDNVLEDETLNNDEITDENDITNKDNSDIDETSKNWVDKAYSSFTKHVGSKARMYFSTMFNLSAKGELGNETYTYDTNNEMGVRTTMDANFVIAALSSDFIDFSSIDNFINSVAELSQTSKQYYGLIVLANKMKKDLDFALMIFHELHNPKINKTQAILNGAELIYRWSNTTSDAKSEKYFQLFNHLRSSYKSINELKNKELIGSINLLRNLNKHNDNSINRVYNILTDIFPMITYSEFISYIENSGTKKEAVQHILGCISGIYENISKVINSYNKEVNKVSSNENYEFDYTNIDFTPLTMDCINLANALYKYGKLSTDLNSANSEGNMSSDLIKNNYLTNLIEQINYSTPEDQNKGLEQLKEFVTKSDQYKYSPIFFGVKDSSGKVIRDGIFNRDSDGIVTINRHAKQLLTISLFDGAKNNNDDSAAMYESMGKNDYLITNILAFNNPIRTRVHLDNYNDSTFKLEDRLAGYFMRTPSDAPRNYVVQTIKYITNDLIDGKFDELNLALSKINTNNEWFLALKANVLNEVNNFVSQLNNVFEYKNGKWTTKKNTDNLINRAHHNGDIVKNGRLTGNFFKFNRLFNVNGQDYNEKLFNELSLYGGDNAIFSVNNDGSLSINLDNNTNRLIKINNNGITPVLELNSDYVENDINWLDNIITNACSEFTTNYLSECYKEYQSIKDKLSDYNITDDMFIGWALNSVTAYMSFDDIFEGDSKIYKDARTFLKRAKEVQAGGKSYGGYDLNDGYDAPIHNVKINNSEYVLVDSINNEKYLVPRWNGTSYVKEQLKLRNGFRAITIQNTVKVKYESAKRIKEELQNILKNQLPEKEANDIAQSISNGYLNETAVNDAQSYITFDEFIARKAAEGKLNDYKDIINKLLDPNVKLEDINGRELNKFVQVLKNFYYDKTYDPHTKTYYSRQIKNAEFVLIPKLIQNTELAKLHDFMVAHDIQQVNTLETSKAGNKNVLVFWDNDGNINENFENEFTEQHHVGKYYYRYLYKQQDVPQHMIDARNKAGIQLMKKILDNATPETEEYIKQFFDSYVANIKDSFDTFVNSMGWYIKDDGSIASKDNDNIIKFNEFYKKARQEASRLGLDSNFIDYITEDCTGNPIMPNYLSLTAQKQESMAQSIFNSIITRQTLPGWHAAQVSSVGIGAYDENGKFRELKYHPEVKDENGNIKQEAYCEVLIPRWSNLIPKDYPIEKLEKEGLDIQLAYRIPTEGKQSISMIKVVGFLDNVYGSTIIVPDEWVIQTGSDFDVDSVYAVVRPMYKDKDGNLKRVVLDESTEEKDIKRRYINKINHLLKDKVEKEKVTKEDKNKYIEEIKEKFDKEINDNKSLQWQIVNKIYGDALYKLNSSTIKEEIKINFNNKNPLIRFNQILKAADDYIKEAKTEKSKNDYIEFKNEIQKIIDILNTFRNTENEIRDAKNSEIKSAFDELYNKLFDDQFNEIVKRAKAEKLISYEDFSKLPILEQASKDEREAHIIDAMYKIMQHNNSREENYSRSNFAAIANAIKKYDALRGVKQANESVYNPFDQIKFMENAMSGAQLKAFSVTRDNFCSINNRLQTYLNEHIEVIYDLTETKLEVNDEGKTIEVPKYNLELIKSTYDFNENSEDKSAEVTYLNKEKTLIKVKHKRYGWSKNNRNIVGELITAYSSQTTAHILDAIKEGSIFNENKYTFGTFKTLVDLGIDYDTAIAFLMQPAITTINDFNFKKESVYGNEYINPINRSLFTIYKNIFGEGAVRQTNKGTDKNKPSEYSSKQSLYDLFNKSNDIRKAIKELFGVNFTTIEKYKFPLNGGLMQKRLANKPLFDTISNEDKEFYDNVFDLVMTSTFDRLFNTTKQIEGVVRCCNPDKFGAKQTIFETRKVIDKIINYLDSSNASGNILKTKDGKNVIQAIYPPKGEFYYYKNLEIDINKSRYPYLAAFLQYSTLQSVKINSELFTLENDNIYRYIKKIESSIGREVSLEEYKRFKKFIVKQIIHEVPKLSQPLTVDDNGHIIPDIELIEEYESNGKAYFNEELIRINGYNVTESYQFNVKDFRNPTKEEIDIFKRLTPAQKVLAILKIFTDGAGIFNQINTNIFNNSEYSRKGYNVQSLKFNDQINDIEAILSEFSKTYYNKNILVKLATIDLIKYAFINENFAFKKGAISKAIPNRILYTTSDVWGMDLISDLNYAKQNILSDQFNLNDTFITNFIRSNRNLIKVNKLNKEDKNKINSLIHKDINGKSDGLIVIHNTEANESLLNICKDSYEQGYKGFIRLQTTNNSDTLYKIRTIENEAGNIKTVYLIPLNYLEYNEVSDLSLNKDNNKYSIEEYYDEIINDFDSENNKKLDSKDYKVQNYEFSKSTPTDNQNYLIDVLETGSSFQKTAVKSFINSIGDPNKLVDSRGDLIGSSIKFIEEIFPVGKEVLQNIEYNGEIYTIGITRYAKNTQSYKEINEYKNIKVQPYNVRFVKAENEGLERLSVLSDIANEEVEILQKAPRDSQGKLLAPNGKPSNLTEKQYAQVRTKAFKKWFGDWENPFSRMIGFNIIFGHPAIGKTTALQGKYKNKFIDWDVEYNEKRDKWIEEQTKTKKGTKEFKDARNKYLIYPENYPNYIEFLTKEWNRVKNKAKQENKILLVSPHTLLKLFPNDFNYIIDVESNDFINRNINRGGNETNSKLWKEGIDKTISNINNIPKYTIEKGTYISDLLDDIDNVSKVVDENGEPLVVYHQTNKEFNEFDINKSGRGSIDFETPIGIFVKNNNIDIFGNNGIQMPLFAKAKNIIKFNDRTELIKWLKNNVNEYNEYIKELKNISEDDPFNLFPGNSYNIGQKVKNTLTNILKDYNYDAFELINDAGAGPTIHTIVLFNPNQVKSAIDNIGIFGESNNIYDNDFEYQSVLSDIDNTVDNIEKRDDFDNVAMNIYRSIVKESIKNRQSSASSVIYNLKQLGFDIQSNSSIKANKDNIFIYASKFYNQLAKDKVKEIEHFVSSTGEIFDISDERLYKHLQNNPADYNKLVDLLLDCVNIGGMFNGIFDLELSSLDPQIQNAINKLKESINLVRLNPKIKKAFDLIFNNYFANEYSTNPLVKQGLENIRTQFGDIDFADLNIADIGHLNNKQIQVVLKMVNSILEEARMFNVPKAKQEFKNELDEINKLPGSYNQDKIINKDGKLIFEYTENYINDRNKFVDKLAEIKDKQGRHNLDYLKTDIEYKKWLYKNTHQPLAKDYYRREIEILEKVINEAPDLLIEYNKLLEESNKDNRGVEFLTDSEKEERIKLKQKIKYLSSELNENGEFKSEDEINKAKALNEYIRNKRILINDYYEYEESDEFKEILNKYLKIKKKYEEDHKNESLDDRLKDSNYREAYEWIQFNTQYKLDNDSQVKVMESFVALSDDGISLSKKIEQIYIREKAFNKFGQKDNSLLSKTAIEEIKKLTEESYENKNDIGVSLKKRGLISIPTKEAKEALSFIFGDNYQSEAEINTITKINNLLEKAVGKNGEINTKDIFNNLSKAEIEELISLYETLDELKNDNSKLTKEELAEYNKIAKSAVNIEAFEKELEEYEKLDDENQLLWRKLFAVTDENGNFKEKKINPNSTITVEARIPNKNIFGYTKYKGQYENTKKSKAIEFIKKHISYETIEEYKDAERKAKLNGTYNEWYDSNHFYNPITNKIEPLRIWTSMVVNPSDEIKGKYDYLPTHDFSTRKIKTNTENKQYTDPNFDPNDTNYDVKNGSYNNTNNLTEKELKTLRLFRKTLKKYALSNEDKQFVKKGYLPRQYKPNIDAAYIAKQALEAVGITMGNKENIWTDDINYNNDITISNKMLSNLKAVGYKKLTPIPKQEPSQSYEEYKKLVDDIKKENETIEKNNLELEKSILNRDWANVMLNFIEVGETNLSREDVKRTLYLLLEDLKQNDAIAISRRDKRAKQDFATSTEEEAGYKKVKQKNAIELVENQFRRIVLNEYKQDSPLRKWADLIQNITSAKYMAFNVPGGIANISIGFTNIMGESFAEDFFNNSDLLKGINRYRQSSLKFLYDMYKDTSTDKTVALSKKFDVVDIDAILERKTNEKTSEYAQRVRNSLYSLQSGGEHFMQNSVLFAMLNSHKIFTDVDGKVRIGSLSNYIVNKEIEALRQVLSSNEDYLNRFNAFVKRIKNNLYTLEQYDKFKLDYITEFLKTLNDKKITDSYIKTRNKLVDEAKKEFDNIKDTIESQLIFNKDNYELSPDSKITQKQLADFKNKVVYVNKKIHGVYDKIGAAKLESHWYGGLVMQYHKHIYPGIMKRFRIKGYYNEITQNVERGSYVTLARFMTTEFKGIGDKINNSESNIALASIQEVVKATINTFMNLKFNYQMLPLWERRNLKRVLGDLSGVVSAMLLGIAIYGFTDDDELKDNDLYALGIYLADRLLSESSMYTPWGAVSEVSTSISNPIAGWGIFKDTYKGLLLVSDMLFNEEFNPNYTRGLYAGENKFKVLLYKNTPIWRIIKRLQNMSENNNYYRINESNINIKLAKRIADYVSPE